MIIKKKLLSILCAAAVAASAVCIPAAHAAEADKNITEDFESTELGARPEGWTLYSDLIEDEDHHASVDVAAVPSASPVPDGTTETTESDSGDSGSVLPAEAGRALRVVREYYTYEPATPSPEPEQTEAVPTESAPAETEAVPTETASAESADEDNSDSETEMVRVPELNAHPVGVKSPALNDENPIVVSVSFGFLYTKGYDVQFNLTGSNSGKYLNIHIDHGYLFIRTKAPETSAGEGESPVLAGDTLVAQGLEANEWYTLEMYVNNVTGRTKIIFGDKVITGLDYLRGSGKIAVNRFETVTGNPADYYVDNVNLTSHHFDPVIFNPGTDAIAEVEAKGTWSKDLVNYKLEQKEDMASLVQNTNNNAKSDHGQLNYTMYESDDDLLHYEGYTWTLEYSFLASKPTQRFLLRVEPEIAPFTANTYEYIDTAVSNGQKLAFPAATNKLDFHEQRWYRIAFTFDPVNNSIFTYINGHLYSTKPNLVAKAIKNLQLIAICDGANTVSDDYTRLKNVRLYEGTYSQDTASVTPQSQYVTLDEFNETITMPIALKDKELVKYSGYDEGTLDESSNPITFTVTDKAALDRRIYSYWLTTYLPSAEYTKLGDGGPEETSDNKEWCAYKLTVNGGDSSVTKVTVKGRKSGDDTDKASNNTFEAGSDTVITGRTDAVFGIAITGTKTPSSITVLINDAEAYTVDADASSTNTD